MPLTSLSEDKNSNFGMNGDYWETLRRAGHVYPEQDLMLALLKDALASYRKQLQNPGRYFNADRAWFFETGTDWRFSFESVCLILGFNAERIRQHLLDWEKSASTSACG